MRAKFIFSCGGEFFVPFVCNYKISMFLQNILQENGVKNPIINFSPFRSINREIKNDGIVLQTPVVVYVTSPIDEQIDIIKEQLEENKQIKMFSSDLTLERIIVLPPVDFTEGGYKFKCLSPITVFNKSYNGEEKKLTFLNPHTSQFYHCLRKNLSEKYKTIYDMSPQNLNLFIEFDKEYVSRKKKISKLITVKDKKYKAWLSPFYMSGNQDLIKLAYEWGLGEMNLYGFGMISIVR